jgi:hypothetical protein
VSPNPDALHRRTPDAPSARERREIARVHRDIERKHVRRRANRPRSQPRLAPITTAKAKEYASHPHPSTAEVRGDVVARAALRSIQHDVARSRASAPGPAVSGYQFLSAMVGPDIAALVPGMRTPYGTRPHATAGGVATNLLEFSPYLRTPYAVARAVRAARAAKSLEAVKAAARPRPGYWNGPAIRGVTRPLNPIVNEHSSDRVPDYNRDGLIDNRDILEHLRRKALEAEASRRHQR